MKSDFEVVAPTAIERRCLTRKRAPSRRLVLAGEPEELRPTNSK
jgi:hypothetical protein